jgi:hypothetical protein
MEPEQTSEPAPTPEPAPAPAPEPVPANTPLVPPITKTTTQDITDFTVTVQNVVLYTEATLYVRLFSDKNFCGSVYINLTGSDYTNWGEDDSYITTFVANWLHENY